MNPNSQGRFTSTGATKIIKFPGGVDWMDVINETQIAANAVSTGYKFSWQRGMAAATGLETISNSGGSAVDVTTLASNGFTYIDSSAPAIEARTAVTGLTAANPAVVTAAGHGLSVGDVVVFSNLNNQPQIGGIPFSVTVASTTFTVGNISLVNSTASTSGYVRRIVQAGDGNLHSYLPGFNWITYISSATNTSQTKIYMSVTHDYVVGQKITLALVGGTAKWGNFNAVNGVTATIVGINEARAGNEPTNAGTANNIVIDYDVSGLGNWNVFGSGANESFVASASVPYSFGLVVPAGEDTAEAISQSKNILADAFYNPTYLGLKLGAGQTAPAGQSGDVIYWRAGTSNIVDNQ